MADETKELQVQSSVVKFEKRALTIGSTVQPSYLAREMDIFPLTEADINELGATTVRAQASWAVAAFGWSAALTCGLTWATISQNPVLAGQLGLTTIISGLVGMIGSVWAYRETGSKNSVLKRVRER